MKDVVLTPDKNEESTVAVLTRSELEIIQEIAEGRTSKEVGLRLGISAKTVEVHRHNILKKTKAKNFIQLVIFLYKKGILT